MRGPGGGIGIIGIGARTPVGFSAPATAAAVRAGIGMMQNHGFFIDKSGVPAIVAPDPGILPEVDGVDRLFQLALPAAVESLIAVFSAGTSITPIVMILAVPEEQPGKPQNLEKTLVPRLVQELERMFPAKIDVTCINQGNAGGILAMERAMELLTSGRVEVALVGGVDSYLFVDTLTWLDQMNQLHSPATIYGFCPGEAAGFCLFSTTRFAQSRGLSPALEVLAVGSAFEPKRIKTETVCIGEGLTSAFHHTLDALAEGSRVNHTICDMNGERYRANEYGFAMLRSTGQFADDADFQTPADCWGDVGAASGPLFCILAAQSAQKGYAKGPLTLIWASSEAGQRAAALLSGNSQPTTRE